MCIAGIDEAGRGPLAGPVVAAACIIPLGIFLPGVNDSKQLTSKKRQEILQNLTSNARILHAIGVVSCQEIDQINILQATIKAMLLAVAGLAVIPDLLLVDGLQLPHQSIPCQKIIKGDQMSASIAAASIIAKEKRDGLMLEYHEEWPQYGFDSHKGYGTAQHYAAIDRYGPCPIHRLSFDPFKSQLRDCAKIN